MDSREITAIWHRNMPNLSMKVNDDRLCKKSPIKGREIGPTFFKPDHNKALYEAMLFPLECKGKFIKESKPKQNKWVAKGLLLDSKKAAKECLTSYASSKEKSTQWLLINHALPVAARVQRNTTTTCKTCGCSPCDMEHYLVSAPTPKAFLPSLRQNCRNIWELTSQSPWLTCSTQEVMVIYQIKSLTQSMQ